MRYQRLDQQAEREARCALGVRKLARKGRKNESREKKAKFLEPFHASFRHYRERHKSAPFIKPSTDNSIPIRL